MLPHDLTIAVSGGLILWFGWYGFNPGSTLSAMDFVGIGRVATNTTLAACAAGLTSIIYGYIDDQEVGRRALPPTDSWPDWSRLLAPATGSARRARSCSAASLECWSSSELNCWNGCALTIPSARCQCTAFAASGERSHWVCLHLASLEQPGLSRPDNSAPLKGLFYGGGLQVLKAQFIGSACITLATFGVAMVVMLAVNATGMLRLPAEMETLRHGSARARHLGISGVCHFGPGRSWRNVPATPVGSLHRKFGFQTAAPCQLIVGDTKSVLREAEAIPLSPLTQSLRSA